MNPQQIFGLQVLLSFLVYGLVARWYVTPRLAPLPLPARFAVPAAYGDLLAGLLALAAIVALRARSGIALPLTWVFNVVGLLDLIHAFYQGLRNDVQLGAAYFIPTFVVPALVITHVMIFRMLVRHPR
jgi:hypothetical protein